MSDLPDNVIQGNFQKKKPESVFECCCGSQMFYLHEPLPGKTGDIECRGCGIILSSRCWGDRGQEG